MNNMDMIFGKRMHEEQMSDYDIVIDEAADKVIDTLNADTDANATDDISAIYEDVYTAASDLICTAPEFAKFWDPDFAGDANAVAQDVAQRVGQKIGIDFENM